MSNQTWNEIVCNYDKNFHLLEEARKEYGDAIDMMTSRLQSYYLGRNNNEDEISHSINDEGFGKKYFTTSVMSHGTVWCKVLARIAAPWSDDQSRYRRIDIAVISTPLPEYLPSGDKCVPPIGSWSEGAITPELASATNTTDWVYCKSVDLASDDPLTLVIQQYSNTLTLARAYANCRYERAGTAFKARDALTIALKNFIDKPFHKGQTTDPVAVGCSMHTWLTFKFIQINRSDLLNIWFYYDPGKRCLSYGHDRDKNGISGMGEAFAKEMKASQFMLGGCPGGVLLDDSALSSLTLEAISQELIKAGELFYLLAGKMGKSS